MPKRNPDLFTTELPDETMVFVVASQEAHCLNEAASMVFQACDGETEMGEVAERLEQTYSLEQGKGAEVVEDTLGKFEKLQFLLQDQTRRAFLTRAAAAIPLAMVLSMEVPAAAQASSNPPTTSTTTATTTFTDTGTTTTTTTTSTTTTTTTTTTV